MKGTQITNWPPAINCDEYIELIIFIIYSFYSVYSFVYI